MSIPTRNRPCSHWLMLLAALDLYWTSTWTSAGPRLGLDWVSTGPLTRLSLLLDLD